jgi:hypothetical protein
MNAAAVILDASSTGAASAMSPWAFVGGLAVLLGALVVVILQLVRMRRVPPGPPEHQAPPADDKPDGPISPDEPR